ncbi:creatininase family protein [Rhodococcus baikonurensis]|uniref:creatininase family protein n=1 Tax=Rhodococcus baikonurensis TaxID=172041 RepID=UPI00379ECD27
MDTDHADVLAVRVASKFGQSLVLPTVRVGYSPHHLGFPGTLSLRGLCEYRPWSPFARLTVRTWQIHRLQQALFYSPDTSGTILCL